MQKFFFLALISSSVLATGCIQFPGSPAGVYELDESQSFHRTYPLEMSEPRSQWRVEDPRNWIYPLLPARISVAAGTVTFPGGNTRTGWAVDVPLPPERGSPRFFFPAPDDNADFGWVVPLPPSRYVSLWEELQHRDNYCFYPEGPGSRTCQCYLSRNYQAIIHSERMPDGSPALSVRVSVSTQLRSPPLAEYDRRNFNADCRVIQRDLDATSPGRFHTNEELRLIYKKIQTEPPPQPVSVNANHLLEQLQYDSFALWIRIRAPYER